MRPGPARCRCGVEQSSALAGQVDREYATLAREAANGEGAAERLDAVAADGEPEPDTGAVGAAVLGSRT